MLLLVAEVSSVDDVWVGETTGGETGEEARVESEAGDDEDAGTSLVTVSPVLLAVVDGDICTSVVVAGWVASTDTIVFGTEGTVL